MKIDSLVMKKLNNIKQNQHFLFFILIKVVLNSNKDLEIMAPEWHLVPRKWGSGFFKNKFDDLSASLRKRVC